MITVDTAEELENALSPRTAMIYLTAGKQKIEYADARPHHERRPDHVEGIDGARIGRREDLAERRPELAAGAGYEHAARSRSDRIGDCVLQRCLTRASAQQTPCSSGSSGSNSTVTW